MEVEHVFLFEADVWAEVFADDALPRGEEGVVEQFFELLGQVHVLELWGTLGLLLHEFNRLQSHVYTYTLG